MFGSKTKLRSLVVDVGLEDPRADELGPRFMISAGLTFLSLTPLQFPLWEPPN